MNPSQFLNQVQWEGLLKTGDAIIPGDGRFPSFSQSGCAEHVDRMLAHMNPSDRNGVRLLLAVFRFLPAFAVRAIVWMTGQHRRVPEPLAGVFRMANLGIKGVVMTLYYSDVAEGAGILDRLGWQARIVEADADRKEAS